ncbi:MAG TPA: hypothetical protein VFM25_04685 [Verrucomicrobiae bacterium]|nr:hypothetical protein [Verrucomicrobiae bacterium]
MKRITEDLSDDVLGETATAEFRAAVLDKTLRVASRRKRIRQATRTIGSLAVILAIAVFALKLNRPTPVANKLSEPRDTTPTIVRSHPLNPAQIVVTQPNSVRIVTSSESGFAWIETEASGRDYTEINDQELLALLGNKPVALIHQGPDQAELIFLNPADRKEFFVQ